MILSPKSIILFPLTPNLKFYANNFCQNILKRIYWQIIRTIYTKNGRINEIRPFDILYVYLINLLILLQQSVGTFVT